MWLCEPTATALVLGSRQSSNVVDIERCRQAGIDVAARRSGGGAVLIVPDHVVWIDVIAPRGVLPDDVRASMVLVGEWWIQALVECGVPAEPLSVHRGGMVTSAWSELVCFAGLGPGEVLLGDRKLVGLSQRRTRHGVRIQGLVHRYSDLGSMSRLFDVDPPRGALVEPACVPNLDGAAMADRLAARLSSMSVEFDKR